VAAAGPPEPPRARSDTLTGTVAAKAYAWELRLQDEIRPDFTIDEVGSDEARARFLADHPAEAHAIRIKEEDRRERKAHKAGEDGVNGTLALAEGTDDHGGEESDLGEGAA